MSFVAHELIRPEMIARRDYQVAIAVQCVKRNTLVILPTGMGKTVVALLVMAHRAKEHAGKVLFLAPTKPLVEQHAKFLREAFLPEPTVVFTGETPPEEREYEWRKAAVICSTPQVIRNDLVSGRISLDDVSLLVFDEAHRAVGNYAYVFIAEQYRRSRFESRILAMTASPGSKAEKIREVCENLGVEGVEVRTEWDPDTKPYVQDVNVEWKEVFVPENLKRIGALFTEMVNDHVQVLRQSGAYRVPYVSKKELLAVQGRLQMALREGDGDTGTYRALSSQAAALKLNHALELVETQGVGALQNYLERLRGDESKAAKRILTDPRMAAVSSLLNRQGADHPKLRQAAVILRGQLRQNPESRMIVFTTYRDTAELLTKELAKVDGLRPARFVGQASRSETDKGMTQAQQVKMVQRFKDGEFNVLVATSVAEEGLDIPATDLVVFFEPVPSEIRAIQRRGRTGRKHAGRVVVLISKGTRDETYHWASRAKEKKMRSEIDKLRQYFGAVNKSEGGKAPKDWFATADGGGTPTARAEDEARPEADGPRAVVVCDHREFNGAVARELARMHVIVRPETLKVADFVLSDRVAVERKETKDYVDSLLDGRLFGQVRALRDSYPAPILLLEGDNLLTARRVPPEVVYGSIASLSADFGVPVLQTRDGKETAELLAALARREQLKEKRTVAIRAEKGTMSDDERLRFLAEGLPDVSAVLAQRLLARFGTIRALANADVADLMEVEGIGEKKAGEIHRVLNKLYKGRPKN